MKTNMLSLLLLIGFIGLGWPNFSVAETIYYMEELLEKSGITEQSMDSKTWISENYLRRDEGQQIQIYDLKNKILYNLNKRDNTYYKFEGDAFDKISKIGAMMFVDPSTDARQFKFPEKIFTKTGKTKKIGDWDCFEVTVDYNHPLMMGASLTMYFCKDVGVPTEAFIENYSKSLGGMNDQIKPLIEQFRALDGYLVQTITEIELRGQKTKNTRTLKKIEKLDRIDQELFKIPEEYKLLESPVSSQPRIKKQEIIAPKNDTQQSDQRIDDSKQESK